MSVLSQAETQARARSDPLGHELGTFHMSEDGRLYLASCVRCKAMVYSSRTGSLGGSALSKSCEVLRAKWVGALDEIGRRR